MAVLSARPQNYSSKCSSRVSLSSSEREGRECRSYWVRDRLVSPWSSTSRHYCSPLYRLSYLSSLCELEELSSTFLPLLLPTFHLPLPPPPPRPGVAAHKYHRAAHTGTVCVSMHKHRDHHRQGPDWHDTGTGYIHTTYSAHSTSSLYIYSFVSQYHPQVTCCWTATLSLFLFLVNYNFENYGEFKLDYKYHILTFWVT